MEYQISGDISTTTKNEELKAFHVSDCEIYAALSSDQAARLYEDETGESCEEGYPCELSQEELDKPTPEFDEDENQTGDMTSIANWLREASPGFLCGTEY